MTESAGNKVHSTDISRSRLARTLLSCTALLLLLAAAGCTTGTVPAKSAGSQNASGNAGMGTHMAGPAIDVRIDPSTIAAKPKPWDLSSPESAVKSYLDWTTYAYRIASSDVCTPTMTADEAVRVDSYVQYNVEKARLLDQKLTSLTIGSPSASATNTLVPTRETWSYRYVSIKTAGQTLGGPYTASYEATYTVTKSGNKWVVAKVAAKALGTVK